MFCIWGLAFSPGEQQPPRRAAPVVEKGSKMGHAYSLTALLPGPAAAAAPSFSMAITKLQELSFTSLSYTQIQYFSAGYCEGMLHGTTQH